MATEFVATVKSANGDYTSLSGAEAGLQNDLTAATIKVFSISAASDPTIAAGDGVTGNTSGATGTCVLVNRARTQILISGITGTFQSGETVKKTTDAAVTVTLSDAGDSPIVRIDCYSMNDTTAVVFGGWTTSATLYWRVYVPPAERHDGKWNTSKYRLDPGALYSINTTDATLTGRLEGLQIKNTYTVANTPRCVRGMHTVGTLHLYNCILWEATGGSVTAVQGLGWDNGGLFRVRNCLLLSTSSATTRQGTNVTGANSHYNNTYVGWTIGIDAVGSSNVAKNCLFYNCTTAAAGTFAAGTDYNATNNASMNYTVTGAGNTHDRLSQTFTFVDAGSNDYHLASGDAGAKDFGVDLSGDATLPFSDDIDGVTRSGTWDIGADEYVAASGTTITGLGKRFQGWAYRQGG